LEWRETETELSSFFFGLELILFQNVFQVKALPRISCKAEDTIGSKRRGRRGVSEFLSFLAVSSSGKIRVPLSLYDHYISDVLGSLHYGMRLSFQRLTPLIVQLEWHKSFDIVDFSMDSSYSFCSCLVSAYAIVKLKFRV
jgi:hypothetical protein